ncbi:MAG TPA: sialidase family protein [Chloroflexota bacterium]
MRSRLLRGALSAVATAIVLFSPGVSVSTAQAFDYSNLTKVQQKLLSGFADQELNPRHNVQALAAVQRNYSPSTDDGCPQNLGADVKVNQNCLNISDTDLQGRSQAQDETTIAQDPLQPQHLVGGFNDYRRGDGNCYAAYSVDGGRNWTDSTIPMSFTRGTAFGAARQYWQAGGDPAVAWDTRGNAYYQCQMFQRGTGTSPNPDLSSAVYIFRSTGNFGASWNFPGRPVVESSDVHGTGVPPFEDKPYMTVDNHLSSPFRDRIYVTYTEFAADGSAYIWESFSADYGQTFSPRHLVSATTALCANTFGGGTTNGNCNANQDSQPFTGPDGALYVVFNNYNNSVTGQDNRNQVLLAKSTDGGNTFSTPIKVADFYDLPDCATYQSGKDLGRACVPEKGPGANSYFRANNYPSGVVNPTKASQIVVSFGSYINIHSNEANGCLPSGFSPASGQNLYTGVKDGACNNDILISVSNNGGTTFTGATTDPRQLTSVTQNGKQASTDQFWQWASFSQDGRLAVSYFDRQYGNDETTGYSDISLSGSANLVQFGVQRVTTGSMPPPTQFSGLFYGDYTGLTAVTDAHPLWMDTRNPDLFLCPGTGTTGTPPATCEASASNASIANDQDAFTRSVNIPTQGGGDGSSSADQQGQQSGGN